MIMNPPSLNAREGICCFSTSCNSSKPPPWSPPRLNAREGICCFSTSSSDWCPKFDFRLNAREGICCFSTGP